MPNFDKVLSIPSKERTSDGSANGMKNKFELNRVEMTNLFGLAHFTLPSTPFFFNSCTSNLQIVIELGITANNHFFFCKHNQIYCQGLRRKSELT